MTRRLLIGAAALALGTSTAFAQSAQTGQAQTGQTPTTATHAPVVYSGCLKAGSDLATGSTLTPGSSSSTPLSGYVLTNAQLNPNASPSSSTPPLAAPPGQSPATTAPPSAPPTAPPAAMPDSPQAAGASMGAAGTRGGGMYRIVGLQDQELQKFANQQVEIRGMMESPDKTATTGTTGTPTSSRPASTTTNPATGTAGTTAAVGTSSGSNPTQPSMVPTFRATSVRVLSANCNGGTN